MPKFSRMIFASAIGTFMALSAMAVVQVLFFIALLTFGSSLGSGIDDFAMSGKKENQVLYIDLNADVKENTTSYDEFEGFFSGSGRSKIGLYELTETIETAAEDKNIKGILLRISNGNIGYGHVEALKRALMRFRTHKKFVYAYADSMDERQYFLSLAADKIYMHGRGFFEWNGLATTLTFFKGAVEKLKAKVEIFRVGKYKSAVEPFTLDKMSEASREQYTALISSLWGQVVSETAKLRKVKVELLNQTAEAGTLRRASEAKKLGLVDGLVDYITLRNLIGKKMQWEVGKSRFRKWRSYRRKVLEDKEDLKEEQIGLVFAEGSIVDGDGERGQISAKHFVKQIRRMADDKKIKAIVLRVNSGGGSALASDIMWKATETLTKPLVVSFGNVAASGGYYMSASADHIFAEPTTITGSIGVFGLYVLTKGFWNQHVGVTHDVVKTHTMADSPSSTREISNPERTLLQANVDEIYSEFLETVASGRKAFKDKDMVHEVAQGRVWTGVDAKQRGLIDSFGSTYEAVNKAAELAKLSSYDVVIYPKKKEFLQSLLDPWGGLSIIYSKVKIFLGFDLDILSQERKTLHGSIHSRLPFAFDPR